MKFEIELTEEEAKQFIECQHLGPITPHRVAEQIKAQLPKEKRWKFLVGYFNPRGGCALSGGLNAVDENRGYQYDNKIYGFTEEQLKEFAYDAMRHTVGRYTYDHDNFVAQYLKTQKAEIE